MFADRNDKQQRETDMRTAVQLQIERARTEANIEDPKALDRVFSAASLLYRTLANDPATWSGKGPALTYPTNTDFPSETFASWRYDTGRALGGMRCHEIGMEVCRQMNFTTEEAHGIVEKYRAAFERLKSGMWDRTGLPPFSLSR